MAKENDELTLTALKAAIDEEALSWTAGETSIAALPPAQRRKYLGVKMTEAQIKTMAATVRQQAQLERGAFEFGTVFAAPAAFDWRNVGSQDYCGPVKDQGACGSCVAFGTCGAIEANMRIKAQNAGFAVDLSEAFLLFCGGGSCSGWGLTSGLDYAKSAGVTDESCFPYQAHNMPCTDRCGDWQARLVQIVDYAAHSTMEARKHAIATVGPVVAGMRVFSDFYYYKSGVYQKSAQATNEGLHCIVVVGYDDAQAAWIVRNSWGTGWGDSGYCLIGYGQDDVLIDSSFAFYSLTVDVQPQTGCGAADYVLVDKHFGGAVVLWAYAGGAWRHKVVTDAELAGVAQELFAATRADVCWDGDQLTLVRAWKTL